ncbi:response regulator [Vibrio sonorensis]|uniref:response regulator n=1 Tax=Vibrio sonorensis TaxID=1004316 RepID=UPI0008D8DE6A|nr:response regulator [Vibrio sonorensis]
MSEYDPTDFTILVVEDHSFSRKALISMLMRAGYENILGAKDGDDALSKLNENRVDLVITDINMPVKNGLELIKAIRTHHTQNPIYTRIIAVTTLQDTATIAACMTLEVDAFLVKPITVQNAQEKIQLAISEPKKLYQQHLYESVSTEIELNPSNVKPKRVEGNRVYGIQSEFHVANSMSELRDGMTLLDDICVSNGGCLVKAGSVINQKTLRRLKELSSIIDFCPTRVRVDQKDMVG